MSTNVVINVDEELALLIPACKKNSHHIDTTFVKLLCLVVTNILGEKGRYRLLKVLLVIVLLTAV